MRCQGLRLQPEAGQGLVTLPDDGRQAIEIFRAVFVEEAVLAAMMLDILRQFAEFYPVDEIAVAAAFTRLRQSDGSAA